MTTTTTQNEQLFKILSEPGAPVSLYQTDPIYMPCLDKEVFFSFTTRESDDSSLYISGGIQFPDGSEDAYCLFDSDFISDSSLSMVICSLAETYLSMMKIKEKCHSFHEVNNILYPWN